MKTAKWGVIVAALCATLVVASGSALVGAEEERQGDLYTLSTCPISGKALGESPIVQLVDGREVRFCCGGCPDKFLENKEASLAKLDEAIVEQQSDLYPLKTCVISGKELTGDAINMVHNNRLVKLCCAGCEDPVKEKAEEIMAKVDEAVIEAQVDSYPLTTCLVSDEPLSSMGDAIQEVHGNQLVQFCCGGCTKKFAKNPDIYLDKIAKAKADK